MKAFKTEDIVEFENVAKSYKRFLTAKDLDSELGKCRLAQYLTDKELLEIANKIISDNMEIEKCETELKAVWA